MFFDVSSGEVMGIFRYPTLIPSQPCLTLGAHKGFILCKLSLNIFWHFCQNFKPSVCFNMFNNVYKICAHCYYFKVIKCLIYMTYGWHGDVCYELEVMTFVRLKFSTNFHLVCFNILLPIQIITYIHRYNKVLYNILLTLMRVKKTSQHLFKICLVILYVSSFSQCSHP